MAETLFAEKGEVWITKSGTRIEWCKDMRVGDTIYRSSLLIDGEHPAIDERVGLDETQALKPGGRDTVTIIPPNG